jgi:hypothetical protein
MNYLVVIFKNKERKKIINKFKTKERANLFFDRLIDENRSVIFETKVENAKPCDYELSILEKKNDIFDKMFVRDDMGRQVLVDLDDPDYKIVKVVKYKIPEKIYDVDKKTKITMDVFIKNYLPKNSIKLISRLNNKVVLQNDNDVKLFSLKDENESKRFLDSLNEFLISQERIDCIIVSESSKAQKKYLYDILSEKGISKQSLYRRSTTFKTR